MPMMQTRRRFLTTAVTGRRRGPCSRAPRVLAAEGPLETTTVRLVKNPGICLAPQYVAEELLRAEGFTDIRYVDQCASLDLSADDRARRSRFQPGFRGTAHPDDRQRRSRSRCSPACMSAAYELFAQDGIRSISDLKGKTVGIRSADRVHMLFSIAMAAHVGLDPRQDIHWVTEPILGQAAGAFAEGKIDAFLGFPPEPQELRARQYRSRDLQHAPSTARGRNISAACWRATANSSADIRSRPSACCAPSSKPRTSAPPTRPCRADLVDGGFTDRYDYALQTLSEVPYDKWREYDPEDTFRFYALRLHEAGLIKSSPQKIIADGTDWRFLNELKRELKA